MISPLLFSLRHQLLERLLAPKLVSPAIFLSTKPIRGPVEPKSSVILYLAVGCLCRCPSFRSPINLTRINGSQRTGVCGGKWEGGRAICGPRVGGGDGDPRGGGANICLVQRRIVAVIVEKKNYDLIQLVRKKSIQFFFLFIQN